MKLSTIIARTPYWYQSRKCVMLRGPIGRGKSTVVSETPARISAMTGLNIGLVIINAPLLTPADSIGYLVPRKVTINGVDHMESIYTDPFWFRTREGKRLDEYDGGIIFVDEIDKADVDIKKVIGEAALTGRLGPHTLPEGWVIWMAGNRQKDRSGSTKELDHLINRRMEIEIDDDIESLNEWMNKNDVHPLYKAFANQNTHIVFADGVPAQQGPWCTPRSMVEAARYHASLPSSDGILADDAATLEEIAGMIGEAAAAQLFAFVKMEKDMPTFDEIVANPMACKLPSKPDASMLICYNLAHRVKMDTATQVLMYIDRMPKEFAVIFGKAAVARDPMLITAKGFVKWIAENASLMAAIGGR